MFCIKFRNNDFSWYFFKESKYCCAKKTVLTLQLENCSLKWPKIFDQRNPQFIIASPSNDSKVEEIKCSPCLFVDSEYRTTNVQYENMKYNHQIFFHIHVCAGLRNIVEGLGAMDMLHTRCFFSINAIVANKI